MESLFYPSLSPAGPHQLHAAAWGNPAGRLTICVHGLTRNSRDFDFLAMRLAERGRYVVCPDVVGRGRSDWLARPELYGYPQALADMAALFTRLGNPTSYDWVGTSMGGLMGLMLAAQPTTAIRKLVLNDIGPFIPKAALERLADYVGANPQFIGMAEAESYLRKVHAPFGITEDAQWRHLATHSVRPDAQGGLRLHYDPAIAAAFTGPLQDVNLWPLWDMIKVPTLLLRGADSDLLTAETAAEMTRRGPCARLIEFANCGHAPALMNAQQIDSILTFLDD
jgi:pimeloyl-ACP methyl ester carboxylesterase